MTTSKVCIPPVYGVAYAHEPPNWWDTTTGVLSSFNTRLDDPRWNGCIMQALPADISGVGSFDYALFRALYMPAAAVYTAQLPSALYLSWVIKTEYLPGVGDKSVVIGLCPKAAGQGAVIRITLNTSTSGTLIAAQNLAAEVYPATAAGVNDLTIALPPWLSGNGNKARVWVNAQMGQEAAEWAIALYVPLTATVDASLKNGLTLGTDFLLWYQLNGVKAGTTSSTTNYSWPADTPPVSPYVPFPSFDKWGEAHLAPTIYETCPGMKGVTISGSDVGTTSPDGRTIFYGIDAQGKPVSMKNTFVARPINRADAKVDSGKLTATFRMRNYGAQTPSPNAWTPVKSATNSADILPGQQGTITVDWWPDAAFLQAIMDGTTTAEQCTMAELSGPVTFIHRSAYNNLTFEKATVSPQPAPRSRLAPGLLPIRLDTRVAALTREVEISLLGIEPLPNSQVRDVRIGVHLRNMPASVRSSPANARRCALAREIVERLRQLKGDAVHDIRWEELPAELAQFPDEMVKRLAAGQRLSKTQWDIVARYLDQIPLDQLRGGKPPRAPLARRPPSFDMLLRYVPMVRVDSSYDSGKTIRINGRECRVFLPLTSFAFTVSHPGEAVAWRYRVVGAGVEHLAENLYGLTISNGGSRRIMFQVEAAVKPAILG